MKKKTKNLKNLAFIFSILWMLSGLWIIIEIFTADFNEWSIGVCAVLFFITGYLGKEYSAMAKYDYRHPVKSKAMIIILLIGLSFGCNGQNDSIKNNTEFYTDDNNIIWGIRNDGDTIGFQNSFGFGIFKNDFPVFKNEDHNSTYHINATRIELNNNEVVTINLLLEYKKECFNDSTVTRFLDSWIIQDTDSLSLVKKLPNYSSFDTAYIKKNRFGYYQLFINKDFINRKTPTFPDFLNWIETRKNK